MEYVWPKEIPELKEIAGLLKCGVCYEYVTTPVSTLCGHTYCSLCIRKWLMSKQVCPSCASDVRENSLRKNLNVENIVPHFVNLCKRISRHIVATKSISPISSPAENRILNVSRSISKQTSPPVNINIREMSKPSLDSTESISRENNGLKSPLPEKTSIAPVKATQEAISPKPGKVSCPICAASLPERLINEHLDKCLLGESIRETRASTSKVTTNISSDSSAVCNSSPISMRNSEIRPSEGHNLKPLKKKVYHLMSDSQLKKEMKQHGLSIQGDRRSLQNRLQRFVVLYNAECDSKNPRSVAELISLLEKEEKVLNTPAPVTVFSKLLKSSKPDTQQFECARQEYIKNNDPSFKRLIEEVRKREQIKSRGSSSSSFEDNPVCVRLDEDDKQPSTPVSGNKKRKIFVIDSDSDEDFTPTSRPSVAPSDGKTVIQNRKKNASASPSCDPERVPSSSTDPAKEHYNDLNVSDEVLMSKSSPDAKCTRQKVGLVDKARVHDVQSDTSLKSQSENRDDAAERDRDSPVLQARVMTRKQSSRMKRDSSSNMEVTSNSRPARRKRNTRKVPGGRGNSSDSPEVAPSVSESRAGGKQWEITTSDSEKKECLKSENLLSSTPDIFCPSPVSSSRSSEIPAGQKVRRQSESSDEGAEDLLSLIALMDEGSSTDFEG